MSDIREAAAPPRHDPKVTTALRRFAISITAFNIIGYAYLGFEQPLTYVNDQLLVMVRGVVVAVCAKWILRAPVRGRMRHYMNPSNFGIAVILVLVRGSRGGLRPLLGHEHRRRAA